MGYSIYIGEAVLETDLEYLEASYTVEEIENEKAPFWESIADPFRDASGKTNGRHPSYGAMRLWTEAVGLYDMFYNKESGFLEPHPGIRRLTQDHQIAFQSALTNYKKKHPKSEPGWMDDKDAVLARLIWFKWWVDWAIENCKNPAICNY